MRGLGGAAALLIGIWVLGLVALGAVIQFERRLDGARHAQVVISQMQDEQGAILAVAFAPATAATAEVPAPALTAIRLKAAEGVLNRSIATLEGIGQNNAPTRLKLLSQGYDRVVGHLSALVADNESRTAALELGQSDQPQGAAGRLSEELLQANSSYGADAVRSRRVASIGTIISILFLLIAFSAAFSRSIGARRRSHRDASTDALTGLGNRRKLFDDMTRRSGSLNAQKTVSVGIFDLDGFKAYNDSFGHPAGDALLARLGRQLATAIGQRGSAYRIGGDEFVVITAEPDAERILTEAQTALTERGDGFAIGCSLGSTLVVAGVTLEQALHVADQRLYSSKRSSRRGEDAQAHDVLLRVLAEGSKTLAAHVSNVGRLAAAVAHQLCLSDDEVTLTRIAAELHDIGKTAIPDAILNKPGPLDEEEWAFIRRHTLIGERILAAAPALARIAPIVRATHERVDGTGYPDRLGQDEIPLTARIVAVVDAYDAMTSDRPYRQPLTSDQAIAELLRCAGSQFDPIVVDAFITVHRPAADQPAIAGAQQTVIAAHS